MTVHDFRVVRATDESRSHVLELLSEHMPAADVAKRYEWLYENNPHGHALTMIAYDEAGTPAGVTSVFPRRVLVAGKERLGSMGGDGYVRPAFRRKGLATALHRACLVEMKEIGVDFMFGPPEPHNLRALVNAGSRVVTQLRRYVRPRGLQTVLRGFARLLPRAPVRLVEIELGDRRVGEVWDEIAASKLVVPVRDAAHYTWRFLQSPSHSQQAYAVVQGPKTIALCAIERQAGRAVIVDFVAPENRYSWAASAVADACGADVSVSQVNNTQCFGANALWRAGFVGRESKPFQVLALGGAGEAIFDASSWYYTWGDGDLDRLL